MTNKKIHLLLFCMFIIMGLSALFAGDVTFYGPRQFTRGTGKPVTETDSFACPLNYIGPGFTLRVTNGDAQGNNRISSAEISINGQQILGPSDFNQQVGLIERTIPLQASNTLSVTLKSSPNSFIIIDIYKFIEPPAASFSASPESIPFQVPPTSSTLSWSVSGADSISIDNNIGNVSASGLVQVSPQVPSTTYSLTASNLAGSTTVQTMVTVVFPVPSAFLSASPLYIKPGASSTLTWSTFAGHTVTLEPGIGNVDPNGSRSVSPAETTTYSLSAVGYGGSQSASVLITVDGTSPQIIISEPANGAFLKNAGVMLKGQVIDSSPVSLKVNGSDTLLQGENTFEVPLQLAEGPNIISLEAIDAAGNVSSASVSCSLDTAAPVLTLSAPRDGSTLNEIPIDITGSVTDTNLLEVLLNNQSQATLSGENFTFPGVNLSEGPNQFTITAEDKAGNIASLAFSVTYIPDNEPPVITIAAPQNNSFQNIAAVMVSGSVTDKSAISYVKVNGLGVTLVGKDFTAALTLSEGTNTITIESEDQYKNKGSVSLTVTVDSVVPTITISSPAPRSFFITPDASISGEVSDSSAFTLSINGQEVPASNFNGSQFTYPVSLTEGENKFDFLVVDAANNQSKTSLSLLMDSIAPQVAVSKPDPGTLTNREKITITVTLSDAYPHEASLSQTGGSSTLKADRVGNGFYFIDVPLVEGQNDFTITGRDWAGNSTDITFSITRDSTPPQVTVLQPANGALLSQYSALVKGSASDAHLKEIRVSDFICYTNTGTNTPVDFSQVVSLVEGGNTISIKALDSAGNVTNKSLAVVLDSLSPTIHIASPRAGALLNTPSIDVSGRVDDAHLSGVTVNGRAASVNAGTNEFSLASLPLTEGENLITVAASDSLGHSSNLSIKVTLDSQPPQVLSVVPADQTTQVPLSLDTRVTLSEPIDPASLSAQSFYLTSGGVPGVPISGSVSVDSSDSKVLVFRPSAAMPDNAEISVMVTSGLKDPAGNALKDAYSGKFFTSDSTPPDAPVLETLPETTSLSTVMVKGSAEKGSTVSVSGGAAYASGSCDGEGNFSIAVSLNPDRLNQLCVKAKDTFGNESIASCVSILQESGEFIVTGAVFEENEVTVTFSRSIDVSTLTSGNVVVSTGAGVQTGTLTTASNDTQVIFNPSVDLSNQVSVLEVGTGIKDTEGIGLSRSYMTMFNRELGGSDVLVQGEVYDDMTGQPMGGALVKLVKVDGVVPPAPVPSVVTTSEGKYVLVLPAGNCLVRVSKENYTYSDRVVMAVPGLSLPVFDSRLTPLNGTGEELISTGGVLTGLTRSFGRVQRTFFQKGSLAAGGIVIYPANAFEGEKTGRLTVIGSQGLQGRLPSGWSPLIGFDLRIFDTKTGVSASTFLQPCEMRASFGSERWPGLSPAGLVLAYWDESEFRWEAVSPVSVSPEEMSGSIQKTGQYVFLIRDTVPVVPAEVVLGQVLVGVSEGSVPPAAEIAAKLDFDPSAVYPGDTAGALLSINTNTPGTAISSGVAVQAVVRENYQLLSGAASVFSPYTADLIGYNYGGTTLKVDFNVSPNSRVSLGELKIGSIRSDLVRYSTGSLLAVVGPEGGTLTGDGGSEVVIAAGAVSAPIGVLVKKIEASELVSQGIALPSGFEVVGALELSLGGAKLAKPAIISLPLTQEQADSFGQDARFITVKPEKLGMPFSWSWVLKGGGMEESSRLKSTNQVTAGGVSLMFPGITEGGSYLFLRSLSGLGYVTGVVSRESQPLAGAVVSVRNHDIKAITGTNTNTNTNYVQVGFPGTVQVAAQNLASKDEGSGEGVVPGIDDVVTVNVSILKTGPRVVSVTPESNATNIPLNSSISVIFSEAVKASSFSDRTVYIYAGTERISGTLKLSTDGMQGDFIPAGDFPSDRVISITITTNVQDLQSNGMASVFSSSFRTVDVVVPEADFSKITFYMPENGISTVVGEAGAVEPGASVILFNKRTGKSVTVTGLSDGSFSASVEALVTDELTLIVRDLAHNEQVLESAGLPVISADRKQVILGSAAAEFVSAEGLGIKIEEGTFAGPTLVSLSEITDPSCVAPAPQNFARLKSFKLDFGGAKANKPVDLSIEAPDGITEDDGGKFFFAREVEVLKQKRVMIIDSAMVKEGRICTACAPFDNQWRQLDGEVTVLQWLLDATPAFVSLTVEGANTVVLAGELVALPLNDYCVFPVGVGSSTKIEVRDEDTRDILYEKLVQAPAQAGQLYSFQGILTGGKPGSDKMPPVIVKSTGVLIFGFDVTVQEVIHQDITVTPTLDGYGKVESLTIEGKEGTAAVRRTDDPAWTNYPVVLVYKLKLNQEGGENNGKYEYVKIDTIDVNTKGGFSTTITGIKEGDRLIVTVEKGDVALGQEFVLTFSEHLHPDYTDDAVPLSIEDKSGLENTEKEVKVRTRVLPSGYEVLVEPVNQLIEGHEYILQTRDWEGNLLCDASGNAMDIKCNFRAKRSYQLYKPDPEDPKYDVYDTLVMGGRLFVAAGLDGLRVLDISNPKDMKVMVSVPAIETINPAEEDETYTGTFVFPGKVTGLERYDEVIGTEKHERLVVIGGGVDSLGFLKLLDISQFKDGGKNNPAVSQYKSQIICDSDSDAVTLPAGYPRRVKVIDHYAFVTVVGAGLVVVDLEQMKTTSTYRDFRAIIRFHSEENISDAAVFRGAIEVQKEQENGAYDVSPPKKELIAAVLVNRYGVKFLSLNHSEAETSDTSPEPYKKYLMKRVMDYRLPLNHLFSGLVLAEDYWVDLDENGQRGIDEISGAEENRDLLFFLVPNSSQVMMVDVTRLVERYDKNGNKVESGESLPSWQLSLAEDTDPQNIIKDPQGFSPTNMREMRLSVEDRLLYVSDMNMGVMVLDADLTGKKLFPNWEELKEKAKNEEEVNFFSGFSGPVVLENPTNWFSGDVNTSGSSQFGLTIEEDLNMAVVGQEGEGVNVIKLGNPKLKWVYKEGDQYKEVYKIAPYGLKEVDNPADYPTEVYLMGIFPGGIAQGAQPVENENKIQAEVWSLNQAKAPMVPWVTDNVKTYKKEVKLTRQTDNALDSRYNVFLSEAIPVTLAPSTEMMDYSTDPEFKGILSGDYMWGHLSADFIQEVGQQEYVLLSDAAKVGDIKPSIRADYIDREKNFVFAGGADAIEKSNSPVNNPPLVSNVMLDTGEFVYSETDLSIPGRGFDFVFRRTHRSQGIYSGPLGWGWDHNYNKRLLELYSGDVIYYDGTGRRERFKIQLSTSDPTLYTAPEGWFVTLKKTQNGTFRLIHPEGVIEFYDGNGLLVKIQDLNSNKLEFYYNVSGQLSMVVDTMGRQVEFEYYPFEYDETAKKVKELSGRLRKIRDYSQREVTYTYEVDGELDEVKIKSLDGAENLPNNSRTVKYDYTENSKLELAHNLRIIIDPRENQALQVEYSGDAVNNHKIGDGPNQSTTTFTIDKSEPKVTDGQGITKDFTLVNGHIEWIKEEQKTVNTHFTYKDGGLLGTVTYPRNNSVIYDYEKGILKTITEAPSKGPDVAEDPDYPVEDNRVTRFDYEKGNLKSIEYPTGLSQHYSYNNYGQVTSESAKVDVGEQQPVPIGQTVYYEYHPETMPGGIEATRESPRLLDSTAGGYLKRSTSSFGSLPVNTDSWKYWENFQQDTRGNLKWMDSYNGIRAGYDANIFGQVVDESITSNFKDSWSDLSFYGKYRYDANGNLEREDTATSEITGTPTPESSSRSADYTYDTRNNLVTANDSKLGLTTYTHDKNDNVLSISGPSGTMGFTYNQRDLVQTATIGSETFGFSYDGNGNLSTLTNPYGNVTHYGYDGYDRISKVTDPLNNVTLIGRANTGNLLSLKQLDATGQQILLQSIRINDPAGRLKSYTIKMPNTADDITYTRIYEDNGKRIIFKDPLERQTVIQLKDDGKVDTVTDAAGNKIKYYYEDGRGNATKKEETVKSADGTKTETYYTEYKYNAHNQVETITDVQTGAVTTFTYDLKGNLTGTIDAEGNTITHKYDELGRRIKTEQHFKDTSLKPVETTFEYYPVNTYNNQTHEGTYSPSNRLKSITDDKGNKTTYEYDYQNRVKKVIYPDLTFTEYTYDKTATGATNSSGNPTYYRLVVEKQRNDTVVKNYYDELQRLMKREIIPAEGAAGTTIETFTYDELSRVKHAADDDTVLDYQFDRASRMDWEKQAGKLIDYTYNKLSNLTDLKYPNTKLIEMQYDQLNRMNLIKEGDFDLASMVHIGRSYRLLSKQYGNGDLITYLYDQGRRLEYLESKNKAGGIINHYRYGYNKINLKTYEQRLHNAGKGDAYGYDALYRLTNVKFNATDPLNPIEFEREKSINHDNLHNTISIIESFNGQTRSIYPDIPEGSDYWKLNQVARFDQWGLEYDKNGNLKQKGTQRYTHDYRNQLVSAVDGTLQVEMKYDVMGRRVQKAVTQGSQTKVRNYYYAGYQLIEERDGNDQVTRQYIYGNGIDEIIRMDKYQGTAVTSYYFHTDSIGSVTAITDAQGNLVERVTYDIYGMPTFWDPAGNKIPESLIGNTILFQGREYDPELNLYYYRARYYDPIMGRFLETDPMGYTDSMNLYQGFNMNPANFTDPWGLSHIQPGVFGTSPGEQQLYWSDPEFRDYVNSYNQAFGTRALGGLQSLGGALLIKAGMVVNAASGGSLALLGGYLMVKGFDNMQAGARTLISGDSTPTFENQALKGVASLITDDPNKQQQIADVAEFGTNLFATGMALNKLTEPGQPLPPNYVEAPKGNILSNQEQYVKSRINELQNDIPKGAKGRITMSVSIAEDNYGKRVVLIGTSEPRGYLRPGVNLREGEILVPGLKHAEQDIINYATAKGLKIIQIGATRPVCPSCVNAINSVGGQIATPVKKIN